MIQIFGVPYLKKDTDILLDEKSIDEQSLDKETKARSDRFSKETKVEAATIRRSQNRNGKLFQSYQGNYNLNTTPQNDTIFIYSIPNIHFQYNNDGVTGRKSYLYQDRKKGIIKHGITYDNTLPEDVLKYKLFGLDLLKIIQNNKTSFKKGGGIHIKKKNRGKFTEYCGGKVTDECINRAKKSNNPKLRKRATFAANARKWKHANGGIFKYLNGTPEGGVQRSYIGGSTSEARKKYFNWDTELSLVVSNLAASYNVSPNLVFDRLSHEGIIDALIRDNNFWVNVRKAPNAPSFTFSNAFNKPYDLFGLDNIYDTYTKGITKTKRPINIEKDSHHNESGEFVNSGTTNSFYDTLELFVAELASRRNQVKLLYPNLTDIELDSATAARYNATNKYFKQLMDSGEYKTKYPINVEGINIPAPTKTDSKYIKDQNIDIDIDYVIREGDPEIFLYNNKSWNPLLFMTGWLVDYPDSPIVKTFLKNYAKLNFSEPDMVNFTILHKEGGEINNKGVDKSSGKKPKKKLVIKRLVSPTEMVNKRPIPVERTKEIKKNDSRK